MQLRPVTHAKRNSNRFCGPAVLSSLTGKDTADTAALLREITGKASITGTHDFDILTALRRLGFSYTLHTNHRGDSGRVRPTLAAWLKKTPRPAGTVFLISAGHHWQLVSGRSYVCGKTRDVVPLTHPKVKRRSRVEAVWIVVKQ